MLGIDAQRWSDALRDDGEFRRSARLWTGSFAFSDGEGHLRLELAAGTPIAATAGPGESSADVTFSGPSAGWRNLFAATPPPFYQDLLGGAVGHHGFVPGGDLVTMAAYYGAIQRAAQVAGRVFRGDA